MSAIRLLLQTIKRARSTKKGLEAFQKDFVAFNTSDNEKRFQIKWEERYPCIDEATLETDFDAHYIYHPAWAARIVREINPEVHIDISSTLHFCSILSAFIPVQFYDLRPAHLQLDNLKSLKADLTGLPFASESISSLSCMHTVEHIGLGRYGDPIDPDGDVKAINELKRVVAIDGSLLFVVPVGNPKIIFNAHRIYDPGMVSHLFEGFHLKKFSLITDDKKFIDEATFEEALEQQYGCGCFWFIKIIN